MFPLISRKPESKSRIQSLSHRGSLQSDIIFFLFPSIFKTVRSEMIYILVATKRRLLLLDQMLM